MKLLIITQKVDENDQLLGFFVEWLKRFAQKFDKLIVLCLEKGEYNLPPNTEVISLGKDHGAGKLKLLSTFYFLFSSHHSDYDAVFVHMSPIWMVLGGPCWKLMGKKRFLWYTSGGVTFKLKIAEKFANVIFTASKESFRLLSNKVIVTGHGIDTELFKPNSKLQAPSSKFQILSVGRISPVKNYDILINAAKILKEEGIEFKITMVGEASSLKKDQYYVVSIKEKIKKLGLEDYFNFVGKVHHKDLPQYYQTHDVFIHLSRTGSLDKTLLEAMSCGITVLSSSEAARSFLPSDLTFKDGNVAGLIKGIKLANHSSHSQILRNYVLENHNLDRLIEKISKIIHS